MKKISLLGIVAASLFFTSCGDEAEAPAGPVGPQPLPVTEVPSRTITGYTSYPVSIEGTVNSPVRAKVPGYITDVLVDEGEQVRKGQLLFKLETRSLSQDASAAQANVNAAQVEVNKLRPLVEKNIISEVQLETAKARLAQAEANYNSIAASIGYANIKSPVDGFVGAIPHREGSLVSPNDPQPLTTVSSIDEVYAYFAMNERDYLDFIMSAEGESLAEKVENLPPVKLELVNGEIYEQEGEIETVTGQVDPSTGTVNFRAVFPNQNRLLANGSSGEILLPRTYENVPVVPEASTYERQGIVYVYKVTDDTLASPVTIDVRDRIQNLIVVEKGIEAGDFVVVEGAAKLRGPTAIQPQPVPFDSIANSLQPVFK